MSAGFLSNVASYFVDGDDKTPSYGRALYAFDSGKPGDLVLRENDAITVLKRDDASGWSRGVIAGKVGWVPTTYIKWISAAEALPTSSSSPSSSSSSHAAGPPAVFSVRAKFDFVGDGNPDNFVFSVGATFDILSDAAADWWHARDSSGREGYVPALYVEKVAAAAPVFSVSKPAPVAASKPSTAGKPAATVPPAAKNNDDQLGLALAALKRANDDLLAVESEIKALEEEKATLLAQVKKGEGALATVSKDLSVLEAKLSKIRESAP